jgi:hypothetical protein
MSAGTSAAIRVLSEEMVGMGGEICENCFEGFHGQCIEEGCYCECQLVEVPPEIECPHGLVHSMCEQCEQEEQ